MKLWRKARNIPVLSELARFTYYLGRTVLVPLMSRRLAFKDDDFEILDGLRFYRFKREAQKRGSFSQCGQDFLVQRLNDDLRGGFFVDVGCNHPTVINNTAYLERHKDWRGVSIDAQADFAPLHAEQRISTFVAGCVGATDDDVTFGVVNDGMARVLSGVFDHLPKSNQVGYLVDKVQVSQRPLHRILAELEITHVDCLFIDVEGYELKVLRGIDFAATAIDMIVVENARGFGGDNQVRSFLHERGYRYRMRVRSDDIFVRRADQASRHRPV